MRVIHTSCDETHNNQYIFITKSTPSDCPCPQRQHSWCTCFWCTCSWEPGPATDICICGTYISCLCQHKITYKFILMDTHGYAWILMDIHRCKWVSIGTYGYPWVPIGTYGYPQIPVDTHLPVAYHGTTGNNLASILLRGLHRPGECGVEVLQLRTAVKPIRFWWCCDGMMCAICCTLAGILASSETIASFW